jgi:type I restriction enzyme S subunit
MSRNVITEKIPEFKSIPDDWKVKLLSDVSWFQEGPGLRNWQFTQNGMKVINITNLEDGYLNLGYTERHISLEEFEKIYKHFAIDSEDIVMASSGATYCKTAVVREYDLPLVMNTSVIRFKPINGINYEYLLSFLRSALLKKQIDFLITGGAQPNFGPAHLKQTVIPLPPLPEQKAIAQVLSTSDAAIHTTEKLIAQKELRKKWLMQQLLTGKKRLKGFEGEWKRIILGDIGEIKTSSVDKVLLEEERIVKLVNYMDVYRNRFITPEFECKKTSANEREINTFNLRKGDILFTPSSETPDDIGHSAVVTADLENTVYSYHLVRFRLFEETTLAYDFRAYVFNNQNILNEFSRRATGSTRFTISKSDFEEIETKIPPTLEEQTAIAQVLQAADKEISLLKAKVEKLREQKKGLMQVLLTGKVRLNINNMI